ncbi:hypothetical protein [Micromonospora sp. NPDC050200]|uniref:hypothetical protein n=1 Tax=Micromonospora sp. NPDC050200 TaxID=3155664 RepID=UPI0033D0B401
MAPPITPPVRASHVVPDARQAGAHRTPARRPATQGCYQLAPRAARQPLADTRWPLADPSGRINRPWPAISHLFAEASGTPIAP